MNRSRPFRIFAVFFLLTITIIVFVVSTYPNTIFPKRTSDPIAIKVSTKELFNANDFTFVFGEGSGWHGYNVIRILPDGSCQYTFTHGTPQWRRAQFSIDAATGHELRKLLDDIDYFQMPMSYSSGVADGTQWFVKVYAAGKKKGVYCDNYFPAKIDQLRKFVAENILAPHKNTINNAPIIQLELKDWESETL